MRRPLGVARDECGTSMIELVTVMLILSTVVGALTTAFVQGTRAELDSNNRFRAQIDAGVALDRLRKDVHCASSISPIGASTSITLTVPSGCPATGVTTINWCALGSGTHYTLYRQETTACATTSKPYADYLVSSAVFTYTAQVPATSLAKLHVDLRVNVKPTRTYEDYDLMDDIVLRNSTRS
jgi:Tfp pilus assembly protein PilW